MTPQAPVPWRAAGAVPYTRAVGAPGPRDAQVSVVGGGAVGAAVTYLLAREGWTDVQLIERGDLCAATSSQAAGMVGQARPTADRTRLAMAAAELYRTFPSSTGYSTDYRQSGAIEIGISGSAPASNRATNGFSIEMGAKPLPPLRASWRSLAPDEQVFNNRR